MSKVVDYFLKYVAFDTQSAEDAGTVPSTEKQFALAKLLSEQLKNIGVKDVSMSEHGYVYGTIPANGDYNCQTVGFLAHMDTSPDCPDENVRPQLVKHYDGKDIILNKALGVKMTTKMFPFLKNYVGQDLITTDGTTLLGADDKAGIAEIMTMAEALIKENIPHGPISIAFTPDEEIGCGSNHFDVKYFNADYAYTIDGGDIHIVEYENFNAFSAKVNIHGRSIHPGSAKNKMINSTRVAYEFDSLLPVHMRPESTEGYEGFNHLHAIQGTCEETTMDYIIRNHDLQQAKKQCQEFIDIVEFLNKKYGYQIIDLTITESYLNMKEALKDHMFIVEQALAAIKENGLDAYCSPIRGGTDGARLTFMGLPCPNLGTGGFNYHGPYEYCSLTMMEKQVQILLHILKSTASK